MSDVWRFVNVDSRNVGFGKSGKGLADMVSYHPSVLLKLYILIDDAGTLTDQSIADAVQRLKVELARCIRKP
jgi:hypothetical protein